MPRCSSSRPTKAGWGTPLPARRARGVALHESFGSIVAAGRRGVARDGRPRVHRVVCAADIGTVVNPGIVAQQMESAVIFGLSAALLRPHRHRRGRRAAEQLPELPVLRLADSPLIETHLVPSTRAPSGVGEPGTPPVAPAVRTRFCADRPACALSCRSCALTLNA
jgi:isoquinoline 1-oxidoreductase beta subunit